MEQTKRPEFLEFCGLMAAIRAEFPSLQKMILPKEAETEESKILGEFDSAIQAQAFSTLNNLVLYQLRGWRELIDECNDSEDRAASAHSAD